MALYFKKTWWINHLLMILKLCFTNHIHIEEVRWPKEAIYWINTVPQKIPLIRSAPSSSLPDTCCSYQLQILLPLSSWLPCCPRRSNTLKTDTVGDCGLVHSSLRPAVWSHVVLQWVVLVSSLVGKSEYWMSVPSSQTLVSLWWNDDDCPSVPARVKCTLCIHQVPKVHNNDKVLKDD